MIEEKKYIGVYKVSDNRWKSQIQIENQQRYLGLFNCPLLAAKAYDKKARPLGRNLNFDNDLVDDISPLSTNESRKLDLPPDNDDVEVDALKLRKIFIGLTLKALGIAGTDENGKTLGDEYKNNENNGNDNNNNNNNNNSDNIDNENDNDNHNNSNKEELNRMLEELSRPLLLQDSYCISSSDSMSYG